MKKTMTLLAAAIATCPGFAIAHTQTGGNAAGTVNAMTKPQANSPSSQNR
jgi:hypothetical protein